MVPIKKGKIILLEGLNPRIPNAPNTYLYDPKKGPYEKSVWQQIKKEYGNVYTKKFTKKLKKILQSLGYEISYQLLDKIGFLLDPKGKPLSSVKRKVILALSGEYPSDFETYYKTEVICRYYLGRENKKPSVRKNELDELLGQNRSEAQLSAHIKDHPWQLMGYFSASAVRKMLGKTKNISKEIVQDALKDYFESRLKKIKLKPGKPVWEKRKKWVNKLFKRYPLIFLQGPKGTGKTYLVNHLDDVNEENIQQFNVGPTFSLAKLDNALKRLVLKAKSQPNHRFILQLDEANLLPTGVLKHLKTVLEKPNPYIFIRGKKVRFPKNCSIILTGNPGNYPGRNLLEIMKQSLVLYFPPFSIHYFVEEIAFKNVFAKSFKPRELKNIKSKLEKQLRSKLQEIKVLLKKHHRELSVREVEEFALCLALRLKQKGAFKGKYLDEFICQSAYEVFGGLLPKTERKRLLQGTKNTWKLKALQIRYSHKHDFDSLIKATEKSQNTFVLTETNREQAIVIYNFLIKKKLQGERAIPADKGKNGLMFVGPSGIGKDALLEYMLSELGIAVRDEESIGELKENDILRINTISLKKLEALKKQVKGKKLLALWISELDKFPSEIVEDIFNDFLTDTGTIIATINGAKYMSKEVLSDAAKDRSRVSKLGRHSRAELEQVPGKQLSDDDHRRYEVEIKTLLRVHHMLDQKLKERKKSSRPNIREIISWCTHLKGHKNGDDLNLKEIVQDVYGVYALILDTTLERLLKEVEDKFEEERKKELKGLEILRLLAPEQRPVPVPEVQTPKATLAPSINTLPSNEIANRRRITHEKKGQATQRGSSIRDTSYITGGEVAAVATTRERIEHTNEFKCSQVYQFDEDSNTKDFVTEIYCDTFTTTGMKKNARPNRIQVKHAKTYKHSVQNPRLYIDHGKYYVYLLCDISEKVTKAEGLLNGNLTPLSIHEDQFCEIPNDIVSEFLKDGVLENYTIDYHTKEVCLEADASDLEGIYKEHGDLDLSKWQELKRAVLRINKSAKSPREKIVGPKKLVQ